MTQLTKSIFLVFDPSKELEYCAEAIKNAGFSHTFLWWGRGEDDRFRQIDICDRLGLEIETAHTSFESINSMWLEGAEGEGITDYLVQSVREARECGIPVLIVHLSSSFTPPPRNTLGLSRYRRVCEEAEKQGVIIAFENLRRTEYLDYIMENISSPARRFCFDCGHEFLYNNGMGVLEKHASELVAFHLHDNFGEEDDHLLPFEGRIDWTDLAGRISKLKKVPPLTLEVMQRNSEPDFAERAFECVCRIESLVNKNE